MLSDEKCLSKRGWDNDMLTICDDGKCVLGCGDKTCAPDETCVQIDKFDKDSGLLSKSNLEYSSDETYDYVCSKLEPSCKDTMTPYIFPNIPTQTQNVYYGAKDLNQVTSEVDKVYDTILSCDHSVKNNTCEQDIAMLFQDDPHLGYYCGLTKPIRAYSHIFSPDESGSCSLNDCLNNVTSEITKYIRPMTTDDGKFVCNYLLDPNHPIQKEKNQNFGFQTISLKKDGSVMTSETGKKQLFQPANEMATTDTSYPNSYTPDCTLYSDLDKDTCPFLNPSSIACTRENDIGYISLKEPEKYCCQVSGSQYICKTYDSEDQCTKDAQGNINVCDTPGKTCFSIF
jgi:hypothetical protein